MAMGNKENTKHLVIFNGSSYSRIFHAHKHTSRLARTHKHTTLKTNEEENFLNRIEFKSKPATKTNRKQK